MERSVIYPHHEVSDPHPYPNHSQPRPHQRVPEVVRQGVDSSLAHGAWLENKGKGITINALSNRLHLENKEKFKIYNDAFSNDHMDSVIFVMCYKYSVLLILQIISV